MAVTTRAGYAVMDAAIAELTRESVAAILVDHRGWRGPVTVDVARWPDGEHASIPVIIDCPAAMPNDVLEFDGRRFRLCYDIRAGHYWADAEEK